MRRICAHHERPVGLTIVLIHPRGDTVEQAENNSYLFEKSCPHERRVLYEWR